MASSQSSPPWIIGGLAMFGALYLFDQINRNRRR
jgi:hypothetical protein